MANLTINPTTGTGNGTITIAPIDMNRSNGDIISSVLVSNGVVTREVDCVQYGMPLVEKTSGSNPVPYTGGTFTYNVSTHYPFRMHNLTLGWYVVTNQWGTQLFADRWYPVESAGTITVTVNPATTTSPTSEDLRIQFDTQPTYYDEPMGIYREGIPAVEPYLRVSPSAITVDWYDPNTKSIQVFTNQEDFSFTRSGAYVDAFKGGYYLMFTPEGVNSGSTRKSTTFTISADNCDDVTAVYTQWPKPSFTRIGTGNIDNGATIVASASVRSDYSWYVESKPEWVSFYREDTSVVASGSSISPNASGSDWYTMVFTQNSSSSSRDANIVFKYIDLQGNTQSAETITITQNGEASVVPEMVIEMARPCASVMLSAVTSGVLV